MNLQEHIAHIDHAQEEARKFCADPRHNAGFLAVRDRRHDRRGRSVRRWHGVREAGWVVRPATA
jgi:hypothetical protein